MFTLWEAQHHSFKLHHLIKCAAPDFMVACRLLGMMASIPSAPPGVIAAAEQILKLCEAAAEVSEGGAWLRQAMADAEERVIAHIKCACEACASDSNCDSRHNHFGVGEQPVA